MDNRIAFTGALSALIDDVKDAEDIIFLYNILAKKHSFLPIVYSMKKFDTIISSKMTASEIIKFIQTNNNNDFSLHDKYFILDKDASGKFSIKSFSEYDICYNKKYPITSLEIVDLIISDYGYNVESFTEIVNQSLLLQKIDAISLYQLLMDKA